MKMLRALRLNPRQNPNIIWDYYQPSYGQRLASGYFEGGQKSPYPRKAVHKVLTFGPGQIPVLMSFEITNGSGEGGHSYNDSVMANVEVRSPGAFGMGMGELLELLKPGLAREPGVRLAFEGGRHDSTVGLIYREFSGANRLEDAKKWLEHFAAKYTR